jgi:hypothetical protein
LGNGGSMSTYVLSFRNTSASDLDLDLTASISTGNVSLSPDRIILPKGDDITKVPVAVTVSSIQNTGQHLVPISLTVGSRMLNKNITKKILFIMPK